MNKSLIRSGLVLVCLSLCAGLAGAADPQVVRHVRAQTLDDVRSQYFKDLLRAALDVTQPDFGDYRLEPSRDFAYQSRVFWQLERGREFDVAWSMTSAEREKQARPIRIPLMKGLLGVRLLLINRDRQARFTGVESIEDLAKLTALQGHDWPDTRILSDNGLAVRTAPQYSEMFRLISRGRYDYFPRGVLEIYGELAQTEYDNLKIEPRLVLTYPSPIYFFVNRDNTRLAERLETGLKRLRESGEFDRLLREHPNHREAIRRMQLDQRTIIRLRNPHLPAETPLDDESLWWDADLFLR